MNSNVEPSGPVALIRRLLRSVRGMSSEGITVKNTMLATMATPITVKAHRRRPRNEARARR